MAFTKKDHSVHEIRLLRITVGLRTALLITSLASIASCSLKQPPECDAAEVLQILKSVVIENAQESILGRPAEDGAGKMRRPSAFYYRNVDLNVSRAFDAGVKNGEIRSCSAVMQLRLPPSAARVALAAQLMGANLDGVDATTDGAVKQKIEYEVRFNDKGDQFEVESRSLSSLIDIVSAGHAALSNNLAWAGTWTGSYQCEPVSAPQDWALEYSSSHVPFEFSVEKFNGSGSDLALERRTNKGGTEKINISFGPGNEANVRIDGANTPRDRWQGYMRGNVRDEKLKLTGTLKMLDRSEVANCSMNLDFTPISDQLIAESIAVPN